MTLKTCSGCGEAKPLEHFNRRKNELANYCRDCNKLYLRQHYAGNKDYYQSKRRKNQEKVRDFITNSKTGKPCTDCGRIFHPSVMHYDHLPEFEKSFAISQSSVATLSIKKIQAEIEKCELVCAICHGYRTYERRNGVSLNRPENWLLPD